MPAPERLLRGLEQRIGRAVDRDRHVTVRLANEVCELGRERSRIEVRAPGDVTLEPSVAKPLEHGDRVPLVREVELVVGEEDRDAADASLARLPPPSARAPRARPRGRRSRAAARDSPPCSTRTASRSRCASAPGTSSPVRRAARGAWARRTRGGTPRSRQPLPSGPVQASDPGARPKRARRLRPRPHRPRRTRGRGTPGTPGGMPRSPRRRPRTSPPARPPPSASRSSRTSGSRKLTSIGSSPSSLSTTMQSSMILIPSPIRSGSKRSAASRAVPIGSSDTR